MRPRCEIHKRVLRWVEKWSCWVCTPGMRDRQCKAFRREFAGPVKREKVTVSRVLPDGREILSEPDLERRKQERWELDNRKCVRCHGAIPNFHVNRETHHKRSRGMNGAYRDDRIENLETLCGGCHRKEQARPQWSKGKKLDGFSLAALAYGPAKDDAA